jgi:hypothetical protein
LIDREAPLNPRELLAEYALGVLNEAEAASVLAYLATDSEARDEYEEMVRVVRLLPLVAEEQSPGEHVRDGLMERIASEPRNVRRLHPARPAPIRRWVTSFGALAAAFALIAGSVGYFIGGRTAEENALQGQLVRQSALVEAAARGTLSVSRAEATGQRMALAYAPGASEAFVYVSGLLALPPGKAFQAWFTRDGTVFEPAEVFTLREGGVWLRANGQVNDYAAAGFTIEDEAGAKTPSQAPFMTLPLGASARK